MSFSAELRSATWGDHEAAEETPFLRAFADGQVTRPGYAAMVAQHYFAYFALETAAASWRDHPVAAPFIHPGLTRVPALERDLEFLYGTAWRSVIEPSKPTLTYVARINQVAERTGGFIAHHYTRYLGDLSGGQYLRKVAERTYDLRDGNGVAFYIFDELGDLKEFKIGYRRALDTLDLDEVERRRIVAETRLAYQLNIEVLDDLWQRGAFAA